MKRFIQKMKYAENYLPSGYNRMFNAIAKYLNVDLKEETNYDNDDSWIIIYEFLSRHDEKKNDELIDIFKSCDDGITDLIDWYGMYIDYKTYEDIGGEYNTDEKIITATRFALAEMFDKLTFDMNNICYTDFKRFVTQGLCETIIEYK